MTDDSGFEGIIRPLKIEDLDQLRPILERWIRDPKSNEVIEEEVEEDLQTMRDVLEGKLDAIFFVAERNSDKRVVGVAGMRDPRPTVAQFLSENSRPRELINMYTAEREKGVGSAVISVVEQYARDNGYTEIVLDSGPRFEKTGWGFYDKREGYERVGIAKDRYGVGSDAPVWKKILNS